MNQNNLPEESFPTTVATTEYVDPAAVQEAALEETLLSARFGIGELYGQSFVDLSPTERKKLVAFKPCKDNRLGKAGHQQLKLLSEKKALGFSLSEVERSLLGDLQLKRASAIPLKKSQIAKLNKLEDKVAWNNPLSRKQQHRLEVLTTKARLELSSNQPCPFKTSTHQAICTKDGGVCSLRLYRKIDGNIVPVPEDDPKGQGGLRATCPNRFHEQNTIFKWVGGELLNQENPSVAIEVGFLESERPARLSEGNGASSEGEDASSEAGDPSSEGEDVGRIDMILVDRTKPAGYPMPWAALEIQAVYFSGKGMGMEFAAIVKDVDEGGTGLIWPTAVRRPDYRSSGPKRLMPQLQTKVPTLRRWGKKMAVVVDRSFYESMGTMKNVEHASNSDIAWFIVDFEPVKGGGRLALQPGKVFYTTLEESVSGLTGGKPVSMEKFEARITAALAD